MSVSKNLLLEGQQLVDSLKGEEFYKFLLAAFKNMADHLEKGGAAYCFHADTESETL